MRVVVVKCDDQGNVDLDDLKAKAVEHSERLASLMVTYPSTHGVYEEQIREICAVVHEHGGQVYLDGANLNALVGVAKPGEFGATCRTSACTRPSASRTVAAARASGRSV
jgi:glycine dehydrogenase